MSIEGKIGVESEVLEVRRVRWRYVKGGLRMVRLLCGGSSLVSNCSVCDVIVSAEIDAIAGG